VERIAIARNADAARNDDRVKIIAKAEDFVKSKCLRRWKIGQKLRLLQKKEREHRESAS